MQGLAELQSTFDVALRGGQLPRGLTSHFPAETEQRFNVYRNNVAIGLTDALGTRFPVIRRLVGEAFFAQMARIYAEAERPAKPILSQWGEGFASFLSGFAPLAAFPYMGDVARIEFQRGVAFHAADGHAPTPVSLAHVDPATLMLALHPCVSVLRFSNPAVSIWTVNQPGAEQQPITGGAEIALILRDLSFNVPVHAISIGDAALIDAIQNGHSLLDAAQLAQAREPTHDPLAVLQKLISAGATSIAEASSCAT